MQVVLGVERGERARSPGSASGSRAAARSHSPPPPHCLSSRAQTCCGQPVRPLVFLSLLLTVLFKISFWAERRGGGEKWKEKIQRGDWIHATPASPGRRRPWARDEGMGGGKVSSPRPRSETTKVGAALTPAQASTRLQRSTTGSASL